MPFNPQKGEGNYLAKGLPLDSDGHARPRLELREFKKNKVLWDLYLLGLWQFQLVDPENPLSYFQIAGIHGLPYDAWPRDDQELQNRMKVKTGFCTHSSILFLSWHRPYLALFETVLRDAMQYVAEQFTVQEGRSKYLEAVESFRMPYWDWALTNVPLFPTEVAQSDAYVVMPQALLAQYPEFELKDGTVKIPNPLYRFDFSKLKTPEDFRENIKNMAEASGTERPVEEQTPKGQEDDILEYLLNYVTGLVPEENIRERLVFLLKSYTSFAQVSNNRWIDKGPPPGEGSVVVGKGFGSFEDIHNNVHVLVGGLGKISELPRIGHMSEIPSSAFDPVFWLHHTNIDRLISIWQGLHDDPADVKTWVTEEESKYNTWITPAGEKENADTDLAPFYKSPGNFWKSSHARDTAALGYAYPETQSWNFSQPDDYRRNIWKLLKKLYPVTSLADITMASRAGNKDEETTLQQRAMTLLQVTKAPEPNTTLTALALAPEKPPSASEEGFDLDLSAIPDTVTASDVRIKRDRSIANLVKGDRYLEWLFNIKAQKHTLDGEYTIHVFLGSVEDDEPTSFYPMSPFHVGFFSPLGQSEETKCGKCKIDQSDGLEVTGQIPLTIALVERYFAGLLESLEEDDVISYLQRELHWEVVDKDGNRLKRHRNAVEGLLVGVVSNEVTLPGDEYEHPTYSPYIKIHPAVTTKEKATEDEENKGRAEGTGITEETMYFVESSS